MRRVGNVCVGNSLLPVFVREDGEFDSDLPIMMVMNESYFQESQRIVEPQAVDAIAHEGDDVPSLRVHLVETGLYPPPVGQWTRIARVEIVISCPRCGFAMTLPKSQFKVDDATREVSPAYKCVTCGVTRWLRLVSDPPHAR